MYNCMNHDTWNLSKKETEVISDPSWINSDPHFTLPSRARACWFTCHCLCSLSLYPFLPYESSKLPGTRLLVLSCSLSLHNKWLPMDCVPLRHYVLRHRGLLQSSVLQMRSVLLDALLGRSTSLSNVNHRAIHASQHVHDPGLPRSRQFVLRLFHERPFQRVWSKLFLNDVLAGAVIYYYYWRYILKGLPSSFDANVKAFLCLKKIK